MREITKIHSKPIGSVKRTRVAAYARVSDGKDAMLHSLSAQISYYNDYIGKRGDWEFAGIYAEKAMTGTKAERPEFQRLLADCRAGKIDMIITKSITRFARNTVTLLEAARELKLLGIDIFFQKENIHTLSADGEFMLTLLASFAQEESRSVSENQKWRIRRMFEQGRPNTGKMYGYRLNQGKLVVIPKEADVVRRIFTGYLSGKGKLAIAKSLNAEGVPTLFGGLWCGSTVMRILRNEKYTGDMLLQKTYRADHISKKGRINRGELPMYHVENSHEAIISKEIFAEVQREIKRRAGKYKQKSQSNKTYPFTGLIRCGQCGKNYRRKHAAAGSKYEKIVWICGTFNSLGKEACSSKQIPENILIAKTAEILGTETLDENILRREIDIILVPFPEPNLLVYVFKNGRTIEAEWQNPSRSESWTVEMRQAASERQREICRRRNEP